MRAEWNRDVSPPAPELPVTVVPAAPRPPDDDVEASLYEKRRKIYPREVHGWFATMRVGGAAGLLGLFYGVCWLRWDERQLLLFDLPARRFNVFWWTFYPQDFLYLALLLILAALALFFFTSLAGRLWCGYACPQTVYTETFLRIERMIEGDRPRQMKLDRAPWGARKIALKSAKHAVWIAFSLWTGFTFVGYFTPVAELGRALLRLDAGPWETFWILFYGFATYGNAGWLREQVCIYMCPYARFQSAMFDRDTLVISYDAGRGEPRGSRRRGTDHRAAGLGDCIDCTLCVQVCPTGIDIRDGLQHQCIACAACIDVCDQVMERMDYPKGLVRYTTQNAADGRPARIVRPRVLIYAGVLAGLLAVFAGSLALRVPVELDVLRDRNALYREMPGGLVRNVYTLKIVNMHDEPLRWRIGASGIDGLSLGVEGGDREVAPGEVASLPVRLDAPADALRAASTPVRFTIEAVGAEDIRDAEEARFLGPVGGQAERRD